MKKKLTFAALIAVLLAIPLSFAQNTPGTEINQQIDWEAFLKPKNMVWKKAPTSWDNAPFLGNGWIGMQVMRDHDDPDSIRFEISRMDAQEHLPYNQGGNKDNWVYSRYRVPIGYFSFKAEGKISSYDLELDLWNAELKGSITTDKGTIRIRAYAQTMNNLLIVKTQPGGGEPEPAWKWNPYPNVSPRTHNWKQNTGESEAPYAKPGPPKAVKSSGCCRA